MSTNTGGWKHTGPATLTFDGGQLINVSDCVLRFTPGISRYDNIQDADGVLDITCPQKGMEWDIKLGSLTIDTISWASGYNGNTTSSGTIPILLFDNSKKALPEGPATLAFTRNDSRACRFYVKRMKMVPRESSAKFTKDTPTEFDVTLVMVDPGDGTTISGEFEEGDVVT